VDPIDKGYKRLAYVRYADDFLIGFIGSKKDCLNLRDDLRKFLAEELKLELHQDKTNLTHATLGRARFLG
jgi:hypothetical protein